MQQGKALEDAIRIILHVDLDAFYASAEQSVNPSLRDRALVVGADPKEGRGRGVVLTASYEARKYGIRSGMPISQAYRLCLDALYIRPNWRLYENLSSRVMGILKSFATKLEQVSIDEAFLDVTDKAGSYDDAHKLAISIKNAVKQETRLTCSIGIAPSKSVAKMASDMQKPNGLTMVRPENLRPFLSPLPVSKISGIGPKSQKLLNELGVRTIGELASYSVEDLRRHFGKSGVWMWNIANGIDKSEVVEQYERKSISAEHTFEEDISDYAIVHKTIELLASEVVNTLIQEKLVFKTVGIKIRYNDFETVTGVRTLRGYTNSQKLLNERCTVLFDSIAQKDRKIRLVGVRVSSLRKIRPEQRNLLTWVEK
jgi:DNA polymerase IV (DinB-like DNA polymerase)